MTGNKGVRNHRGPRTLGMLQVMVSILISVANFVQKPKLQLQLIRFDSVPMPFFVGAFRCLWETCICKMCFKLLQG